MAKRAHHEHSSLREKIVEHAFIGDALRLLWRKDILTVEVLRSEFDAHGYDLVLTRGVIIRHVQFKASIRERPARVSVSSSLAAKQSGCVVWIHVDDDLNMGPFFFFGANPGLPLPDIASFPSAKRTTPNSGGAKPERQNHRLVPGMRFKKFATLDGVLTELLGPLNSTTSSTSTINP